MIIYYIWMCSSKGKIQYWNVIHNHKEYCNNRREPHPNTQYQCQSYQGKPPLIKEDGHILYFRDASYLSCIFWLMINKQVDEALDLFNELEYDDIFITCLEYVYRRFLSEYSKISTIENLVSSRFMDILNKNSIKQSILNYIFSSSMQEK